MYFVALPRFVVTLLSAVISLSIVRALGGDPPPAPLPIARSVRKGSSFAVDSEAEGPLPTLGTLVNVHSAEALPLDGIQPSAQGFGALLHDRVTGEHTTLDAKLLGLLRTLAEQHPGARVEIISGYRSPKLNEMLRKKGHHVASHSQHSLGHAMDFRFVGLTPQEVHDEVDALKWPGGLGEYDHPSDRFVHVDVGPKRRWFDR